MRNLIILFCFLLLAIAINAQKKYNDEGKWAATLTGAILPFPEITVGLQPGVHYKISKRFSLLNEFTFRISQKDGPDSTCFGRKYFRVQPELRYSFFGKKTGIHSYLGLRVSLAARKFSNLKGGHFFDSFTDSTTFYKSATINSPVKTISLQWGVIFFPNRQFSLDVFFGAGAKFNNTKYSDVVNPRRMLYFESRGPHIISGYYYNNKMNLFHANAGMRLIYHFRQ
jgi:hypothetical protein